MIGYLRGIIMEKRLPEVWIDVSGVGYRVRVGDVLGSRLTVGEEGTLYIHTSVREDAIDLYGFADMNRLKLFELLISVSGIGPKTALGIVGNRSAEHIEKAVREADVAFFQALPGIGKKSAQRIIVDLKGKMPSLKDLDLRVEDDSDDVVSALMQFGFKREDVLLVLQKLEPGLTEEQRIREGLRQLGKR